MQEKSKVVNKMVKLKFNQIAVNQKYIRKNLETGMSLWDEAHAEYVTNILKNPMYGGLYRYLPNEDAVIKNMLVTKYKEPYVFSRATNQRGQIYTLDDIKKMTDKEKEGIPFYEMTIEDAAFYLDSQHTKILPREDRPRVYTDQEDFKRDTVTIPLAEIVE